MKTISWVLLISMIFIGIQCKMSMDFGDLRTEPSKEIITEISGTVRWQFNDHPTNRAFVQLWDYNSLFPSPQLKAADTTDADGKYNIVYESIESYCFGCCIDLRLEVRYGVIKTPKYSTEIECSKTPIELDIKI